MIEVTIASHGKFELEEKGNRLLINGKSADFELEKVSEKVYKVFKNNKIYTAVLQERNGNELQLSINGESISIVVSDHIDQILKKLGMNNIASSVVKEIKAPMPGTILSLGVEVGQEIQKGDQLLILEAMKMENVIKSPGEGVIAKILVSKGENVEKNQLLISFE